MFEIQGFGVFFFCVIHLLVVFCLSRNPFFQKLFTQLIFNNFGVIGVIFLLSKQDYKSKLRQAVEDGDLSTVKEMLCDESWSSKGLTSNFCDSR